MPRTTRGSMRRSRVGQVSVYPHHGGWHVYYREDGRPVRRKVADNPGDAKQLAAQINAQLASSSPTMLAFRPIPVSELRQRFLDYHETVLASSLATVARYRTATLYLERYFAVCRPRALAHELDFAGFAAFLRSLLVAPNGHANTEKRRLRDKGIQFITETCRAMYAYAGRHRHLPPYAANPFAESNLKSFKIRDAKLVFVFDAATELAFLKAADDWEFGFHFLLAKSGIRIGEAVHALIEDVDLKNGWLQVTNKAGLGWHVKTGVERSVPLIPEVVTVLKRVIGQREHGPVFLRRRFENQQPILIGSRTSLEKELKRRCAAAGSNLSRIDVQRIAQTVWRDAGAIDGDRIRTSFIQVMRRIGNVDATCPKSWRHTFATLLQDANVDPLIRQVTLGHQPASRGGLGMTAHYTHTRPETQRAQIENALRRWPDSLAIVNHLMHGGHS